MKKNVLWVAVALMMAGLISCSNSDDDNGVANARLLIGEWAVSHHSNNPDMGDTTDMWSFTFEPDGTGRSNICTRNFTYELKDNHIILHYLPHESIYVYGPLDYEYKIVNISKDIMEWDEVPDEHWGVNSLHLIFYRK
jgi:hypothetical protein